MAGITINAVAWQHLGSFFMKALNKSLTCSSTPALTRALAPLMRSGPASLPLSASPTLPNQSIRCLSQLHGQKHLGPRILPTIRSADAERDEPDSIHIYLLPVLSAECVGLSESTRAVAKVCPGGAFTFTLTFALQESRPGLVKRFATTFCPDA